MRAAHDGHGKKMPEPDNRPSGSYTPNTIPKPELIRSALFVVGLAAYLGYSITKGGIYLAGPHGIGTTYSGFSFFLIGAAMLFGIANLAANVIDHFDRRENEERYVWFRFVTQFIGWSLMLGGLIVPLGV
jgi:hypothetical protein